MAGATHEESRDGAPFVYEDDGSVTAVDEETGLARGGETKAEALALLAEVLELAAGGGDPIEDPDEFLAEELYIDPDDIRT